MKFVYLIGITVTYRFWYLHTRGTLNIRRKDANKLHLLHEATLAIAIGVNLGVELIHQAGLSLLARARDRAVGVGVVSISPGTVLTEGVRKVIFRSVSVVVAGEVVVLLAVVTTNARPGGAANGASTRRTMTGQARTLPVTAACAAAAAARCCTSEATGGSSTCGKARARLSMYTRIVEISVSNTSRHGLRITLSVANDTKPSSGAGTDVLWDTLEGIVALLTASKGSALGLELVHGHGRQSSCAVMGSFVVVNLVNRNSGVNNIGLNGLLLNDRLDGLMDVVVHMLTANGSSRALTMSSVVYTALVLEVSLLIDKVPLSRVVVAVVKLAVLNGAELSSVLFRKDLAVLDRLNCAVIMVLMNLLVNCSLNLLVNVRLHNLVLHSRSNGLVDGGIMVSRLRHEVGDSCLGLIHCSGVYGL